MKRLWAVLWVLLVLFAGVRGEAAVRVGYIPTPGFTAHQFNGRMNGYAFDWLRQTVVNGGMSLTYRPYDNYAAMVTALTAGNLDVITGYGDRPEGTGLTFLTIGEQPCVLYMQLFRDDVFYEDFKAFNGLRVALLRNSSEAKDFARYAARHGFTYQAVFCASHKEVFHALDAGDADIAAASIYFGTREYRVVGVFGRTAAWLAFPAGSTTYDAIASLQRQQLFAVDDPSGRLDVRRYHGNTFRRLALTREEKRWVEKNPSFRLTCFKRAPMTYVDEETGAPAGINIDIMKSIADMAGMEMKFEFLAPGTGTFDPIRGGSADAIGSIVSLEGRKDLDGVQLTLPYLYSYMVFIGRQGAVFDASKPHRIALTEHSTGMAAWLRQNYADCPITFYPSQDESLRAVITGQADFTLQNIRVAARLLQSPRYEDLALLPSPLIPENYCLAISNGAAPEFLSILNKGIRALAPEDIYAIVLNHTANAPYQHGTSDYLYQFRLALAASIILLILLILLLYYAFRQKRELIEALTEKNEALTKASADADFANQAKSRFLARMSHELRTPMNAILGFTAIAQGQTESPTAIAGSLQKIRLSSQALLSIINDILDMSAIESNKLQIKDAPFLLDDTITTIREMYQPQCELKGVSFTVDDQVQSRRLSGDQNRLNQILLNLVSNAVKFTGEGGAVRVSFAEEPDADGEDRVNLVLRVADTGIGMTEEFRQRLFRPFEQASALIFQKYGGSGLGLSITKNLTTLMNGSIDVDTALGKGTTFTIRLPFLRLTPEPASTDTPTGGASPGYDFSGCRVLVAEDNALNLEIATALLENVGLTLATAPDGQQAVERFQASAPGEFGLILMDIQMPVLDGYEATRRIRTSGRPDAATIPIVAMTANAFPEDIQKSREAGMNDHLAKPIEVEKLYQTLAKFLR